MSDLTFTRITGENRSELHRLMQQYARELDEHQNRTTDPCALGRWTDRIIEKQDEPAIALSLCYVQSSVIGFLFGRIDSPEDKGCKKAGFGCVMELYVLPEYRRAGYGREMFLHLQAMFRTRGARRMYLAADPVTGKPFWEAMGFVGTGEISPENGQAVCEKAIPDEAVFISVSEFIDEQTARKIAQLQWNAPEQYDGIASLAFDGKTETDCFNVIAQNEAEDVVGRLFCLQNSENKTLWYYGDLFVAPEYRRRHIARRMLEFAERVLADKWCGTLRCYVGRENAILQALQAKAGFAQRPYKSFNRLINDGQLMYEKELLSFNIVEACGKTAAYYVTAIFSRNAQALHSAPIPYSKWRALLSAGDSDEKHFLIRRGAVPCAYMKLNGLDGGDAGWLSMLAVEPAFQRSGAGRFAVSRAEEFLRSAGKAVVKIHTTPDNSAAKALYESCGYALCGSGDVLTYEKRL